MNFEIGNRAGDYEIAGVLGAGGMGEVYKVRNVISERIEAMKVLLPDLESEPALADRFLREIKVQASLAHPNIASLYTALRVDNRLLMLMEFVEGQTLEQKLQRGPMGLREALDYILQALAALSYAHARGVVHRDIKPANMMLTPEGVVKLMDFGIAKAAADRRLTMTGTTMGSLYYMPPEQIKGAVDLDARADLYSVGVSLYELVTGKRPFDGDSQFAIMNAHLEKQPVPPTSLDPSLPEALNDIVLMAVAKDPDQRFQTAEAFRKALGSVAAPAAKRAAATQTIRPGPPPAGRPPRRGLWVAAGALAAALALVAVIQFGPWRATSANPSAQQPMAAAPAEAASAAPGVAPQPEPATAPAAIPPSARPAPARDPGIAAVPLAQPVPTAAPVPRASPTQRPPAAPAQMPAPVRNPGVAAVPVPQPAQTAAPVPRASPTQEPPAALVQTPAPPQRPAADPAHAAEMQEARERLVQLASRAGSVRAGLDNLRRAQAAQGFGIRGDILETLNQMNYAMEGAASAVNAGDVPAAKRLLTQAERHVERLEKFLGR